MCHGAAMSDAKLKSPPDGAPALQELDRVQLKATVVLKERTLHAGMEGVVVYCHGSIAYEVEFPGINDFFQIYAENLKKI